VSVACREFPGLTARGLNPNAAAAVALKIYYRKGETLLSKHALQPANCFVDVESTVHQMLLQSSLPWT